MFLTPWKYRELLSGEKEGLIQLPTDKALLGDPAFRSLVEKYAAVCELTYWILPNENLAHWCLMSGILVLHYRIRMPSLLTMLRLTWSYLSLGTILNSILFKFIVLCCYCYCHLTPCFSFSVLQTLEELPKQKHLSFISFSFLFVLLSWH